MTPPAGVVDGLLAGRYRLVARIGTGGNGEVWRAHDERLDRDVAVKVLRPELADDEDVRARFRAEARHAGGLRHPGIAAVFDFAEGDDGAWLVMELVQGQSLAEVLRQSGRLTVDRTLDVVEQTAAALQAAHDGGVVHRDVKPGNLLLRDDGRLIVTDFGIAHAASAAALTRTGQVVGTAAYLSPEQASGRPVSGATDLYALGVVAHECLSGSRPFERDDPVAVLLAHLQAPPPPLPADVPAPVADLVHRLLAKDPADRPAPARQVQQEAAELRWALAAVPAVLPPTAVLPRAVAAAPVPTGPPVVAAPVPPVADRPGALGLAGRPGQRRAVRATALALGLLALALGVRDATRDDPSDDVREQRPASTAPPVPSTTAPAPAVVTPQDTQPEDAQPAGTQPQEGEVAPAQQPATVSEPVPDPVQPQGEQPGVEEQRTQVEQEEQEQDGGKGKGESGKGASGKCESGKGESGEGEGGKDDRGRGDR